MAGMKGDGGFDEGGKDGARGGSGDGMVMNK